MGGWFGITPGGDGIRTPIGNIYARGSGGRRAAADRYWAEQEKAKQKADWQNTLGYYQDQSRLGSGGGGPQGDNDEARAAARIRDPAWRQSTTIDGVFGGQISPEAAQIAHPFLDTNYGLRPSTVNQNTAILGHESAAANLASQQQFADTQSAAQRAFQDRQNQLARDSREAIAYRQQDYNRELGLLNSASNQRTNESSLYEARIEVGLAKVQALRNQTFPGEDVELQIAQIEAQMAADFKNWQRALTLEQTGNGGQNTGTEVPRNYGQGGQNTGTVVPRDYGGNNGQNKELFGPRVPGAAGQSFVKPIADPGSVYNNINKDIGVQANEKPPVPKVPLAKLGKETYDMNESQLFDYVLNMAGKGTFFDLDDINPQLKQRIMYAIEKKIHAGTPQ